MICGAMLRSGEMQIWEWGCLCGREGSNWGSCSWEWRGRGHEDPGFPKSCVLCITPTAIFILQCFHWHVKTAILRAVNWASNSSLPSAGCTCWGFRLLALGCERFLGWVVLGCVAALTELCGVDLVLAGFYGLCYCSVGVSLFFRYSLSLVLPWAREILFSIFYGCSMSN